MEIHIIWIIIMAVLFVFVWLNNKRNMNKRKDRLNNRFEDRYASRRDKH